MITNILYVSKDELTERNKYLLIKNIVIKIKNY